MRSQQEVLYTNGFETDIIDGLAYDGIRQREWFYSTTSFRTGLTLS